MVKYQFVEDEINESVIKPISQLHPPKEPKIELDNKDDEFFVNLAQTTEFKRFIYRVLYGKAHRTEKLHGNLEEKVKIGLEAIRDPNFSNVIKEMKKVLIPSESNLKPSQINNK